MNCDSENIVVSVFGHRVLRGCAECNLSLADHEYGDHKVEVITATTPIPHNFVYFTQLAKHNQTNNQLHLKLNKTFY